MKKSNEILLLGIVVVIFIVLMTAGLKGWNNLVAPNLGKIGQFSVPVLLGFSFLAGAVSFFSPCAFALFPGYAAFYLGSEAQKKEHPAKLGIMVALGVITFFILLSAAIIIVGKGITRYLGYVAPTIGFILIILGLILFAGYSFKTDLIPRLLDKLKSKDRRSKRNIYLFGFGYGAVSIGCTLPLLFALVIVPITTGELFTVFLSLLVYSMAMGILMIFVTYLVAWSENSLIKGMGRSTGTIKKLSGLALIIIGAYLVYYNIFYSMLW
ncbi:MAG: cytochrome c biogenesis CcdA family protein [bacterium]